MAIDTLTPARRGMLTSIVVAAVSLPTLAAAGMPARSDRTEAAFADWKRGIFSLNNDNLNDETEDALWERVTAAEETIVRSNGASPRLAAMRLLIGLQHATTDLAVSNAICCEDIPSLRSHIGPYDWDVKCMFQALSAITGAGGAI